MAATAAGLMQLVFLQVHIQHRDTGKDLQQLRGHTASVNALAWNPTCPQMLVSASDDCSIRVWLAESVQAESPSAAAALDRMLS